MKNNICKINLEQDRPVINILGEICWGFQLDDFEKKIGAKKEVVETLLERLLKEEKSEMIETCLSVSEVEIIKKALKEVEKEIDEWEFQTRIGITINEACEIKEKLTRQL